MSITSDRIRENGFIHPLADDAADEIEALESERDALRARLEQAEKSLRAAEQVPDEAVSILADVIRELENGFVRCETCGDQEDTATLDCMDDLRKIHAMLSAAPEGKP